MNSAWENVEIARNPNRKTALDYIEKIFDEFVELHGDRLYKDDMSTVCGLARIGEQNFTIIAQQKGRNTKENIERNFGMPNPESYRKAIRLMKQAEKFNRPIVTFVDTKGAYPGIGAEERGQGEAIARSMFEMAKLEIPIITVVIGEGSSGGALAISVGNKILMLENAIYSILSPEGYASILWKDSSRVKEAAEKMKLTAKDLYNFKIVDKIIKENDNQDNNSEKDNRQDENSKKDDNVGNDNSKKDKKNNKENDSKSNNEQDENFEKVSEDLKKEILKNLKELQKLSKKELVEQRYQKFRKIGEFKNYKSIASE